MSANVTLPTYSRYLLATALAKGPHTLDQLMVAVADAPWARGRSEEEFSDFLEGLPGVSVVDGHYVSDHAQARGRTAPVDDVSPGDSGVPGAPAGPGPVRRGAAAARRAAAEPVLSATVTNVAAAAGLVLVDGPVVAPSAAIGRVRFGIFEDSRPVIGGRYLVTLVGAEVSITPDVVAELIRLTEDHRADRAIVVGRRPISAASHAFARGKPVVLVEAPEAARLGREA